MTKTRMGLRNYIQHPTFNTQLPIEDIYADLNWKSRVLANATHLFECWMFCLQASSKSRSITAFCTCSRFSASSNTTDCGPSITSADCSYPRTAGRQLIKI